MGSGSHIQRNLFEILLNQPKIRLYLPFSSWFRSKRTSVWIKINWKMANTIWFRVDFIRFLKDFSVCKNLFKCVIIWGNYERFCCRCWNRVLLRCICRCWNRVLLRCIFIQAEISSLNLIKSDQIWIVITLSRLIWH